jgi:hypothetical protein
MNPAQTKAHLVELLRAGHAVTVRWDCGGDESFVYTSVDSEEVEYKYTSDGGEDFAYGIDQFLTTKLKLPDAGEFSLNGSGTIALQGLEIVLTCRSEAQLLSEEEQREMGVPEEYLPSANGQTDEEAAREWADEYSGRIVLFELAK